MRWSGGSVDDRARYLKQQAELGGAEVIISRKATELVTLAGPAGTGRETRDERREHAPPVAASVTVRERPQLQDTGVVPAAKRPTPAPEPPSTQQSAPSTPKAAPAPGAWRKGAPAIPGPGLSVEPPVTFPELTSLAAEAACGRCEQEVPKRLVEAWRD